MKRGGIFLVFILVAVGFLIFGLDSNNLSFGENRNEYLLILAVILIGGVYFFRRNK